MLGLFGQIPMPPGTEDVIAAANRDSWLAGFLVLLVIAIVCTFGYVLHRQMRDAESREKRMDIKQNETDLYIRTTLTDVVRENSKLIQQVLDVIDKCKAGDATHC